MWVSRISAEMQLLSYWRGEGGARAGAVKSRSLNRLVTRQDVKSLKLAECVSWTLDVMKGTLHVL